MDVMSQQKAIQQIKLSVMNGFVISLSFILNMQMK